MKPEEIIVTTDAVDPGSRNDFRREVTRPVCDTTLARPDAGESPRGTIRFRPLGELLIGTTSFNAPRYRRTHPAIAQGALDFYLVQVLVAGALRGIFDGRSVSAGPGDICIIDLARPYASEADAGARLTVSVPRKELETLLGNRNLHGAVLKADRAITRLLTDYLHGLAAVSGQLSADESVAAREAAVRLLASGLIDERVEEREPLSGLGLALRARVLEFIDANISRPDLTVDLLMRRFRISRAHLYRTLADDGGVARIIRDRRLDLAYAALARLRERKSVAEVARECGFSGSGPFLRAFRARFGITPGAARRDSLDAPPRKDDPDSS